MEIKLYQSVDSPCSYLDNKTSSSLIVDPELEITQTLSSNMNHLGYRRSGEMLYKPNCSNCNACQASRVIVDEFKLSRSHKRLINKISDLRFIVEASGFNQQQYQLYEKYINLRHHDGDMFPPSKEQYESFLCRNYGFNFFLKTQLNGETVSICQFDQLSDGLSAVYTFFDPDFDHLSLGVVSILQLINLTRKIGLPYLYLGYYIQNCSKMNYKTKYRPIELFDGQNWTLFNK
jgi:arginine-tRNA-protein transferase